MTGNAFYPSLRNYDLAPPVPEVPFGMRTLQNTAASPASVLASSALPKASKKMSGLLRSPSLGGSGRGKKSAPQQTSEGDLSPTTPRAAVFPSTSTSTSVSDGNVIGNEGSLPSPTKAGMLVISKANESLNTARLSGLGNSLSSPRTNKTSNPSDNDEYYPTTSSNDSNQIPSKLGTIAAMDKIATIENNIKEARFLALWDKSERSEMGVIKLSLTSNAAREAGIA